MSDTQSGLRGLPSVDRVLSEPAIAALLTHYKRDIVVRAVRAELEKARAAVASGAPVPTAEVVARGVVEGNLIAGRAWPTRVINATGVILHTNLGRAPLSAAAVEAARAAAEGYSDLELHLEEGKRGSRHTAVARLLQQLTGAEAAIAVNNNAGAVLLGLAAIAAGREVIVSRGEASEIGGGFRIPQVLEQSGATLVEVGTVNRTYARDYEAAITPNTGALLVVHRSNFKVVGFTHEPQLREVVEVGRSHGVPVLHDLGSGALLDTAAFGLSHEPMPQESLAAGADLVFFSGDKLLGGPQAGIAVGRRELVAKLASHPLARALRADKMTLAALYATLIHYARDEAQREIPIWRMIAASPEELAGRARAVADAIGPAAEVVPGTSAVGGGSLPTDTLPTWLVRVTASSVGGAEGLARRLRVGTPAVMGRIEDDAVVLDLRTVEESVDPEIARAVRLALG